MHAADVRGLPLSPTAMAKRMLGLIQAAFIACCICMFQLLVIFPSWPRRLATFLVLSPSAALIKVVDSLVALENQINQIRF